MRQGAARKEPWLGLAWLGLAWFVWADCRKPAAARSPKMVKFAGTYADLADGSADSPSGSLVLSVSFDRVVLPHFVSFEPALESTV
jgi:hypothetical protein